MSRLASIGLVAVLTGAAAACGTERTFDQGRPVISPESLGTVTVDTTAAPFVPTTAPTTVAPPTQPPQTQQPAPQATSATTAFVPTTAATTVPAPTQPPPSTIPDRYVVQSGDTLFGIAQTLGVELDDLLAVNSMNTESTIRAGDELAVPEGGAIPEATSAPAPTQPSATSATTTATTTATTAATTAAPTEAPPPDPPPEQPSPGANPPPGQRPPSPGAVSPTTVDASCQSEDSTDGDGNPTSFNPGNLIDGDPTTAWRCDRDQGDQQVTFHLDGTTTVTAVGLINGYTKDDPNTEVDRYLQNHRVRQVRWTFSDGTTVVQDLADNNRGMQTQQLDAPVEAEWVRLEVLETYPPPDGTELPRDAVAISEIEIIAG